MNTLDKVFKKINQSAKKKINLKNKKDKEELSKETVQKELF